MLRLDNTFLVKCLVEAIPGRDGNATLSKPEIQLQGGHLKDGQFGVMLTVKTSPEGEAIDPYRIEIGMFGTFGWESKQELTEEELSRNVVTQAAGVLYGAVREQFALLSGRGPFGVKYLPAHYFHGFKATGDKVEIPMPQVQAREVVPKKKRNAPAPGKSKAGTQKPASKSK